MIENMEYSEKWISDELKKLESKPIQEMPIMNITKKDLLKIFQEFIKINKAEVKDIKKDLISRQRVLDIINYKLTQEEKELKLSEKEYHKRLSSYRIVMLRDLYYMIKNAE